MWISHFKIQKKGWRFFTGFHLVLFWFLISSYFFPRGSVILFLGQFYAKFLGQLCFWANFEKCLPIDYLFIFLLFREIFRGERVIYKKSRNLFRPNQSALSQSERQKIVQRWGCDFRRCATHYWLKFRKKNFILHFRVYKTEKVKNVKRGRLC